MVAYTTAKPGYLQWVFATLKIKDCRANYLGLIDDLLSMLSASQCKTLECVFFVFHINVAKLIRLFLQSCRCPCSLGGETDPHVGHFQLIFHSFSNVRWSKSVVKSLSIKPQKFQAFSFTDLECLKGNDQWLSDTHVTFCLLFVPLLFCSMNLTK